MSFISTNLEDELKLTGHSSSWQHNEIEEDSGNLDLEELVDLIDTGHDGLARFLIQRWLRKNPPDVAMLELILKTDDRNVTDQNYINWCKELLTIDPENTIGIESLQFFKSREMENMGISESTIQIDIVPRNYSILKSKMDQMMSRGDFNQVLSTCEKILDQGGENEFAIKYKAMALTAQRKYNDAAFEWSEWIDLGLASIEDKFNAARTHYNCKHFSEALEILEEIRESHSNKERVLDIIIRAYYSLFNWEKCLKESEEILEINSRNPTGLKYRRLSFNRVTKPSSFVIAESFLDEEVRRAAKMWYDYL